MSGTSATPFSSFESGIQTVPLAMFNRSFRMERSSFLIRKPVSVRMRTIVRKN